MREMRFLLLLTMAFRSLSVNTAPAHPLSVTPGTIVDTDILPAFSISDASPNSQGFPAGFTPVTGSPGQLSVFDGSELAVALKIASGESGNYSLTGTASIIGGVGAFSGREQATTPHRSQVTKADSNHASVVSFTTTAFATSTSSPCDVVVIIDTDGLGVDATHVVTGYTIPAGGDFAEASPFTRQGCFAYKENVAAGFDGVVSGTITFASGGAAYAIFVIALADGTPVAPPPRLANILAPQQRMAA